MHFTAHAVSNEEYQAWLAKVRGDAKVMDQKAFAELTTEQNHDWHPVTYYGSTEKGLFDTIIAKHAGENHHFGMKHDGKKMSHEGAGHEAMQPEAMDHAAMGHDAMDHAAMGHEAPAAAAPAAATADGHAGHTANEPAEAAHAGHGASGE